MAAHAGCGVSLQSPGAGPRLSREEVVVASGGAVLFDDRQRVEGQRPGVVGAAPHAPAVAAAGPAGAADGGVVLDRGIAKSGGGAGDDGEATPQAVPAVTPLAALAADRSVVGEHAGRERQGG